MKGGTEKGQNFGVTYKIPIAAFRSVRRCQDNVSKSRVDRVAMFHLAEALWPESLELLAWSACFRCQLLGLLLQVLLQRFAMSINEWPTHETYWNLRKWHKMANSSWFCPFFLGVHSSAVSSRVRNQALGTPSARLWEDFWGQSWCGKHSLMGGGGS